MGSGFSCLTASGRTATVLHCRICAGARAVACGRDAAFGIIRRRGLAVREARDYFREDRTEAIKAATGRIL